ncbi:MAG: DUF4124 domain-containing protein [Pseudomonadota bacterium]|nr:DUF4124 domain-containing protein [Pseudomonadota bacterium]
MNRLFLVLALSFAALLVPSAQAGMLYKSVNPNGAIMFSDVPPAGDARILEQRPISSGGGSGAPVQAGVDVATQLIESDAAVARANAQVDLAEHALALARRDVWTPRDGLKLVSSRPSRVDEERIEFYKRNVLAARQSLMELLRDRMVASR